MHSHRELRGEKPSLQACTSLSYPVNSTVTTLGTHLSARLHADNLTTWDPPAF